MGGCRKTWEVVVVETYENIERCMRLLEGVSGCCLGRGKMRKDEEGRWRVWEDVGRRGKMREDVSGCGRIWEDEGVGVCN